MPYDSSGGTATGSNPIAKSFGLLTLLALGALVLLRLAFGSVRAEVGIR